VESLGERGNNWLGWSGSGYVASRHLQGCSPRLCWLRTVRLTPMSKYWTYRSHAGDMGPINLVVGHRQELGLRPLLHWLARERSWVRTCGSVSRRAVDCVGSPFSREQWDLSICRRLVKSCHVRGPPAGNVRRVYVDWRWKRTCRVGRVFPYRVYIVSNHRDSRIWVTACLCQSSRS
jgi:hypothetical protein